MLITLSRMFRSFTFSRVASSNLFFKNANVSCVPIILPTVHIVKKSYISPPASCDYFKKWAKRLNIIPSSFYSTNENWTNLSYEDLKALINSGDIQLIDVREPKEIEEQGSLPNSVNIPLGQVKDALLMSDTAFVDHYKSPKPQKWDVNIVFYGLGPIKSKAALQLAVKYGYKKARHYGGGWEEWSQKFQSGS